MSSRRSFRRAIYTRQDFNRNEFTRANRSLSLSRLDRWQFANGTSVYLAGSSDARMHVSALYHSPRLECKHLSLAEVNTAERGRRVRATQVITRSLRTIVLRASQGIAKRTFELSIYR